MGNNLANLSISVEEHDLDRHLAHAGLVVQGNGVDALRALNQLEMKVWNLEKWPDILDIEAKYRKIEPSGSFSLNVIDLFLQDFNSCVFSPDARLKHI